MPTALLFAIVAALAGPEPLPAEPIALVYAASGSPTLREDGGPPRKVDDVGRVFAGTTLIVPGSASLRLAFLDGRRFELRGPARARVTTAGLQATSGSIQELPAVPPLPRLPPVRLEGACDRAAAIRLRSTAIAMLAPLTGCTALAGQELELRFEAVRGAAAYAVEVRGANGKPIAAQSLAGTTLRLPAGVLQPGERYSWSVEAVDRTGTRYQGHAGFSTLTEGVVASRIRLHDALHGADAELLEAFDHELGLLPVGSEGRTADGR